VEKEGAPKRQAARLPYGWRQQRCTKYFGGKAEPHFRRSRQIK
jgi:hypothetical protein